MIEEILKQYSTQKEGLSSAEASVRIEKHGLNKLQEKKKDSPLKLFLSQFLDVLIFMLIIAAIASYMIGNHLDAIVILVVVIINSIIGFIQEYRAENAMEKLKSLVTTVAHVKRDGTIKRIPGENLAVGDIVILEEGDKVPADLILIEDYDLMDDKDREKYIKDLERSVRSSYEYRQMVQYLREYMNMNSCAFLPNVTNDVNRRIRIELHHSPFTLHDICSIILNKRMKCNEILTIEAVAYEVMFVHYSLMVGLIPLSETVHELVHTQYLFIPTDKVYGYYRAFVQSYYNYIDPELLDKLD